MHDATQHKPLLHFTLMFAYQTIALLRMNAECVKYELSVFTTQS